MRTGAALAAGETQAAIDLAAGAPKNAIAQVEAARAKLQVMDLDGAERQLATLKHQKGEAVQLARAELAYRRGDKQALNKELQPLLDGDMSDAQTMRFIASLPPGYLPADLEKRVLAAAQRTAKELPELASRVALRAARGGARTKQTMALLRPDSLSPSELPEVEKLVDPSQPEGQQLIRAARQRIASMPLPTGTRPTVSTGGTRIQVPSQAAAGATSGHPSLLEQPRSSSAAGPSAGSLITPDATAPQVTDLAEHLIGLLEMFPPLASDRREVEIRRQPMVPRKTVVLVRAHGSVPPFWWPYAINLNLLKFALRYALTSFPYYLDVIEPPPGKDLDHLSAELVSAFMEGNGLKAEYLLLYNVASSGNAAVVSLALIDTGAESAYEFNTTISSGSSGLIRYNAVFFILLGVLVGGVVLWMVVTIIRAGQVIVEVARDPGSERDSLTLLINHSSKPPKVDDPIRFDEVERRRGPQKGRRKQTLVGPKTIFPRVPAGRWYIHVFGAVVKGGEVRSVTETFTQELFVKSGETTCVKMDLDPQTTEYRIRVRDGDPVTGAIISSDREPGRVVSTDTEGQAIIELTRGHHILRVQHGDQEVNRELEVVGGKVQHINIDWSWVRRAQNLSRGIDVADANEILPLVMATAGTAFAPARSSRSSETGARVPELVALDGRGSNRSGGGAAEPRPRTPGAEVLSQGGLLRYQRIAELGRGAMGVVFKARDMVLERDVAIKLVSQEVREHPEALKMFLQEAKALAALNHPNVVTVYDQGQDGGETFMVMEFVEGTTLDRLLEKQGRIPIGQALDIADQICAGLSYAHSRRIVHRDIKPANIFLSSEGVVKIGDFGLARVVRQVRLTQTKVCGTPLYMSPEQIRGTDVDFRSDIYSLGCTLFEVLTGRPPFISGEVMYHHMYTPPPAPSEIDPEIPAEVDRLILSCLEKDKAARVASADDLRSALKPLRTHFG